MVCLIAHNKVKVGGYEEGKDAYIGSKKLLDVMKGRNLNISNLEKIYMDVQQAEYEIVNHKKSTYYGIGLSLNRLVHTILKDEYVNLQFQYIRMDNMDIKESSSFNNTRRSSRSFRVRTQ